MPEGTAQVKNNVPQQRLQGQPEAYPDIHYHIASENREFVLEQIEKGFIDFKII